MHWRLSNYCGVESGSAFNGGAAGWEYPYTGGCQTAVEWRAAVHATRTRRAGSSHGGVGFQSCVERRAVWHTLKRWRAGSSHTLVTSKAVWFGGGVAWLHLFLEAAVELLISWSRKTDSLMGAAMELLLFFKGAV